MNINFNTLFQKSLPLIYVILFAFLLNSVIFFYLPKSGVDFVKNDSLFLDYKKYGFYSNIKNIEKKVDNESSKQIVQTLSKYNLKAIYLVNNDIGWITIEEKSGESSFILAQDEQIDGYKLFKFYKNYVLFIKENKEFKLEIKEEDNGTLNFIEPSNNQKQEIVIKNNGAIISRDYLNSYTSNIDKVWKDITIDEIKNANKIEGFKISKVVKNSVFEKIGLKEGDIIKTINNNALNSYGDAMKVYSNIKDTTYLNIEVLRKNEVVELNYEIN
ncbi:MAG: PDZ domain-containing protein [Aliarcobacter sp.]|nr:PDZ domain-containing protein [Aliarcobacter sp.]